MGAPTHQTKDAIDAMLMAGFERDEFSVRVLRFERRINGRRVVEYGDAVITLNSVSKERVVALIPRILRQNLGVTEYVLADGHRYYPRISATYEGRGKHEIVEFSTDGRVACVREVVPAGAHGL